MVPIKCQLGSRLALLALAIQFVLSFGYFHGVHAREAVMSQNAPQARLHHAVGFATRPFLPWNRNLHTFATGPVGPGASLFRRVLRRSLDGC
jgi:hypothetical protein